MRANGDAGGTIWQRCSDKDGSYGTQRRFRIGAIDSVTLLSAILGAVWFLLPAGLANIAPVIAKKLVPSWDFPVDHGLVLGGRRLFGSHKTWRGIVAGVIVASATFAIQQSVSAEFAVVRGWCYFDYAGASWLLGAWMGAGALVGDLVKSLFKRRLGRPPGQPWFPFDQIDWLLGTIAFVQPFVWLPLSATIQILVVGIALHVLVKLIGFALKLDDKPI